MKFWQNYESLDKLTSKRVQDARKKSISLKCRHAYFWTNEERTCFELKKSLALEFFVWDGMHIPMFGLGFQPGYKNDNSFCYFDQLIFV